MYELILERQKNKKYKLFKKISFIFFFCIYTLLDHFNGGYPQIIQSYGLYLAILNIIVNIIMAYISSLMITYSTALFYFTGQEGKGTFLSFVSVLFGILTYGCTSCVITFFSSIGLTLSIAVLPLAGFPYKIISLILVVLGYFYLKYEIKHKQCQIKRH